MGDTPFRCGVQDIERLSGSIQSIQIDLDDKAAAAAALRVRRAELQPEVAKLLQAHAAVEEQQRAHAADLRKQLPPLLAARTALTADVRPPRLC